MKAAIILAIVSAFAWGSAEAGDARCKRPPYGATENDYTAARPAFDEIAKAISIDIQAKDKPKDPHPPDWYVTNVIPLGVAKACRVKFDGNAIDAKDYRDAGIDDKQIGTHTTTALAILYFHSSGYPPTAQNGQGASTNQAREVSHRENAGPDTMLVYALFFCSQNIGEPMCYFAKSKKSPYYQAAEACEQAAREDLPIRAHSEPGADGKFTLQINGDKAWYECRSVPANPAPIYQIFQCATLNKDDTPGCHGGVASASSTLQECEELASRVAATGGRVVPRNGRYYFQEGVPGSEAAQWMECRAEYRPIVPVKMNPAQPVKLK